MKKNLFLISLFFAVSAHAQETTPPDFVRLSEITTSIVQDMRYSTSNNFMGKRASGYLKGECILQRDVAIALKNVQQDLAADNQTLVVFDCYRPQKAVTDFVNWVNSGDEFNKKYFPKTHRSVLIKDGYIADKSNHSRGYTVDLAIAPIRKPLIKWWRPNVCGNRRDPQSLNFGTPFDCFDKAAATDDKSISQSAQKNRQKLKALMEKHGFRNYSEEWWHYTLRLQPQDAPFYDFDVQ